ncbi:MAG: pyridoxal phosphate-dependent aminotransferase [Salinivirgaceae bacterium]|nr:pyridoxal phosphate-dependent aminotransferase [Salinivirgaceae bacterium]
MRIKSSHTVNSSILAMGNRLRDAMKETGNEYLLLNRGVNSVVNIDLKPIIEQIDFNSNSIQVYPGSNGKYELRKAINEEYFENKADINDIIITGGGISGLDIAVQNIEADEIILPKFFWGSYAQLLNLRQIKYSNYESYEILNNQASELNDKAVIICDPGNPKGDKYPDQKLIELIEKLDNSGATIIFDSPYRRLFYDRTDSFYQKLLALKNVIIVESFSKSLGLSGQRIGFLHTTNKNFNEEALLRITYATNGVNSFSQVLIAKLLSTPEGQKSIAEFKSKTLVDIKKNIEFLKHNNLLATELYEDTDPVGIFTIINKAPEELFNHRIGSVGLDYFVAKPFNGIEKLSRILVSYPHKKFVSFFESLK